MPYAIGYLRPSPANTGRGHRPQKYHSPPWAPFLKKTLAIAGLLLGLCCRAQDQARSEGYYQLGYRYKEGIGQGQDFPLAFKNFELAANLGNAQGIYALAYMRYKGLGCTQDYDKAARGLLTKRNLKYAKVA